MKHPDKIFATVNGASTDVISGQRGLIGGWHQHPRDFSAEYVRADAVEDMVAEARREALQEACDIAEKMAFLKDLDEKGGLITKMQGATAAVIANAINDLIHGRAKSEPTQ